MANKKQDISPPAFPLKLLKWLCNPEYHPDIEGDLLELYHRRVAKRGQRRAGFFLFKDVILLLRPGIVRTEYVNRKKMFQHNLIIIYRSFKRFKSTSIINVMGLSTGLACALLIFLWVNDELHVDKFHEKDSHLYHVMEHWIQGNGIVTNESTSGSMADALAQEMPEVEYATTVRRPLANVTLTVEDKNIKATGQYVGKDFFHIFSYPIIHGNKNHVWADRNSMMISEALAMKLFNASENIIGKTVELQHEQEFFISGVFETVPSGSSAQFDFVLSFEEFAASNEWVLEWHSTPTNAYVVLKSGTDVNKFNQKISDYVKIKTNDGIKHRTPFLKRYSETYLYGNYENGVQTGGRIEYVELFSVIAIFILVIACINFMNLS
ncbi:MAG TPA: ABC transporter permease, partial [Cyclobacteriaceae bacterium]